MPTYEYECTKCGNVFEVRQSFSDAPVEKCATCKGKVKKLFSPPAIIFKGQGWHCTDYKSSGGPSKSSACKECPSAKNDSDSSSPAETPCASGKCAAS